MQPKHDLSPIPFEQGPVISTFKTGPVPIRRIGETDSNLVVDNEVDDSGIDSALFRGFVGHLRDVMAKGWLSMGLVVDYSIL